MAPTMRCRTTPPSRPVRTTTCRRSGRLADGTTSCPPLTLPSRPQRPPFSCGRRGWRRRRWSRRLGDGAGCCASVNASETPGQGEGSSEPGGRGRQTSSTTWRSDRPVVMACRPSAPFPCSWHPVADPGRCRSRVAVLRALGIRASASAGADFPNRQGVSGGWAASLRGGRRRVVHHRVTRRRGCSRRRWKLGVRATGRGGYDLVGCMRRATSDMTSPLLGWVGIRRWLMRRSCGGTV